MNTPRRTNSKSPMKRWARWAGWCLPVASGVLMVWVGYWWHRSTRTIDQWSHQSMSFDPQPVNAPPSSGGMLREQVVYPPGTVSYRGTFTTRMADNLPDRLLLRTTWVTSLYEKPEPTAQLAPILGWQRSSAPAADLITYNIPRGNVYLARDNWHWNGFATWSTYMDGISGRYVMLPHWFLMLATATPGLSWFAIVGRRKLRRRSRIARGRCVCCGYNRRGLDASAACPECGVSAANSASLSG